MHAQGPTGYLDRRNPIFIDQDLTNPHDYFIIPPQRLRPGMKALYRYFLNGQQTHNKLAQKALRCAAEDSLQFMELLDPSTRKLEKTNFDAKLRATCQLFVQNHDQYIHSDLNVQEGLDEIRGNVASLLLRQLDYLRQRPSRDQRRMRGSTRAQESHLESSESETEDSTYHLPGSRRSTRERARSPAYRQRKNRADNSNEASASSRNFGNDHPNRRERITGPPIVQDRVPKIRTSDGNLKGVTISMRLELGGKILHQPLAIDDTMQDAGKVEMRLDYVDTLVWGKIVGIVMDIGQQAVENGQSVDKKPAIQIRYPNGDLGSFILGWSELKRFLKLWLESAEDFKPAINIRYHILNAQPV